MSVQTSSERAMNRSVSLIVAHDESRGIGADGKIPWDSPEDRRHFRRQTMGSVVVCGRKTWESLPEAVRPLPGRFNVVLSRAERPPPRKGGPPNVRWVASVDAAIRVAYSAIDTGDYKRIFVIGGEQIYREFLRRGLVDYAVVTVVAGNHGCDATAPPLPDHFRRIGVVESTQHPVLRYESYQARANEEEQAYLDLAGRVIDTGVRRSDRTGVGTRSLFGETLRFDLRGGRVPLLTTKRVFWRGVVQELLFFLRGDTDAKNLAREGVHIWDANGTRAFLDHRGLREYPEGVLGPVYGWQWRRFGAPYDPLTPAGRKDDGKTSPFVDQVASVIALLRGDPMTRRALISAWNPNQLNEMALPPCHVSYQFWISSEGQLHCALYQRSGDIGLGVPFNIASASLLTHLVARATGTTARELVAFVADAHVYETHIAALRRQMLRSPRPFPTVRITDDAPRTEIWKTEARHIRLRDYNPCMPNIRMPMAV